MVWYAVRSFYRFDPRDDEGDGIFEERVVIFQAEDIDAVMAMAEQEADEYADTVGAESLDRFQSFVLADEPGQGAEVFSLMRDSDLDPSAYLDRFFDTGDERHDGIE